MTQTACITIALKDVEISATILRLCVRLDIPAYAAGNIPVNKISTYLLIEKPGQIVIQSESGLPILIYLALPLRLHEIQVALDNVWQRHQQQRNMILPLGKHIQLDMGRRQIVHMVSGATACELTEKETELLAHLYRCGETGEDKETLLTDIWGYHPDAETRTIDSHLYRLRQKLAELPAGNEIEIIAQNGYYRLVVE